VERQRKPLRDEKARYAREAKGSMQHADAARTTPGLLHAAAARSRVALAISSAGDQFALPSAHHHAHHAGQAQRSLPASTHFLAQ